MEGRNLFSAMSKDLMKFMILTVLGKQKRPKLYFLCTCGMNLSIISIQLTKDKWIYLCGTAPFFFISNRETNDLVCTYVQPN